MDFIIFLLKVPRWLSDIPDIDDPHRQSEVKKFWVRVTLFACIALLMGQMGFVDTLIDGMELLIELYATENQN